MIGYLGVSDCLKTHSLCIHSAQCKMNKLRFLILPLLTRAWVLQGFTSAVDYGK